MAKVLLVGCGQLGTAIATKLHANGIEVVGVRKSSQSLPFDMQTIQADILKPDTLKPLASINPDYVIYCISATARTDEAYAQYYVQGLQHIIDTQQENTQLKRLFFISSTRVYGQVGDALLNENTEALPNDFGGRRLLEAESLLTQCSYETTVLRLSGIYSAQRLYLINMAKNQSRWPQSNGWSNRIHESDAAGFIAHLITHVETIFPLYIVTDSKPVKQYEALMWLAERLGIDTKNATIPSELKGKRLSNQRLLSTGYGLEYPDYKVGYTEILEALQQGSR